MHPLYLIYAYKISRCVYFLFFYAAFPLTFIFYYKNLYIILKPLIITLKYKI